MKINKPMPKCCDECFALDESGDYPMCRITGECRGYNFPTRSQRMDNCPLVDEVEKKSEVKFCVEMNDILETLCKYIDSCDYHRHVRAMNGESFEDGFRAGILFAPSIIMCKCQNYFL